MVYTPPTCPECGSADWGCEYRTADMSMVVLFGSAGVPAFRYCFNCGHQQAEGMEPEPWPDDFTFPLSQENRDRWYCF